MESKVKLFGHPIHPMPADADASGTPAAGAVTGHP